jgi:hypothetical protein
LKNHRYKPTFFCKKSFSKNAEFDADFKSVEKVVKKSCEKIYEGKNEGIMEFLTFLMYATFSTDSKSVQIPVLLISPN